MSYQLAEPSLNPIKGENWERILKFLVANIAVGILVAIVMTLAVSMFGPIDTPITLVLLVGVVLTAQAFMLSWYEEWRGCHFKKE